MPASLRVKSFVISTEDIKLDKGLMTSTIEIEKVYADRKYRNKKDFDEDSEDFNNGGDRTEIWEPSESDMSAVERKRVGPRGGIDVFTGDDPIFNVHNLKLRI